jgi:hypothetical protein
MAPEVKELVSRRWAEYGIDVDAVGADGRRGRLQRLLRH